MIQIYHNPRCRKSREGLAVVEASGQPFEVIKYLEEPLNKNALKELLEALGMPAEEVLRKNEAIWKSEYKGKELSEDDILQAMLLHPKLIERPIVKKDTRAVIGRPAENIKELLG